jgi:hypothetical protein
MDMRQAKVANLYRHKLIPDAPSMPTLDDSEFARDVERVLELRPDLASTVIPLLQSSNDDSLNPAETVAPELLLVVAAAYYTNPRVNQALGYGPSQRRTAPLDEPAIVDLRQRLASVIARGPLYVPAP